MKRTVVKIDGYTGQELDDRFQRLEKALQDLAPSSKTITWIKKIETSKMLGVSTKTLQNWNKAGVLMSYSIGNRIYYRSDEVEAAMKPMNS